MEEDMSVRLGRDLGGVRDKTRRSGGGCWKRDVSEEMAREERSKWEG
jgi:hypothetical protein